MKSTARLDPAFMSRDLYRSRLRPPERLRFHAANDAPPAEGELLTLDDGRTLWLRPIHADDVEALKRSFAHLSQEEVRLRFLHVMKQLPEELAKRLCRLDPDTEIAFVLIDPPGTPEPEIHALAQAYIDPVTASAEYAILVQRAYTGHGLGTLLMHRIIDACSARGVHEIWGDVLAENHSMLDVCDALGFERHIVFNDSGLVRVTLTL